jgi:hypothetical protein
MAVYPGSIWLKNNWNPKTLPNDCWIAANYKGIIETAPSISLLYRALSHMPIRIDTVTIAYVWFGDIQ